MPVARRFTLLLLLAGCRASHQPPAPIATAYVGPHELELLAELSPNSPVAATLRHGQQVEILQWKRRFARLRTPDGRTGWADGRLLLNAAQMARLRLLSMSAASLPSQGKATVYDVLNVHTEPNRAAPSFYQLREGLLADVIAHQLLPRTPYQPAPGDAELPSPLNSYAPPGQLPPGLAPLDDWSLVRLPDGRAGWVLTAPLVMAIPDEVAQYAEGQRITSYFPLARLHDRGQTRHHWLWTTLSQTRRPYQFDSFRVFVWSLRRRRYETAYIERNLIGYFPVEVSPSGRFSLIIRDNDGQLRRRTYAFQGYRVRLIGKAPWAPPANPVRLPAPPPSQPSQNRSLWNTLRERLGALWNGR